MKMKLGRRAFGVLAAAAVMALPLAASAQNYKLRYSDLSSPRGPRSEALSAFAEKVKERSDGRIEIEILWSGALVSAKDTLKAVGSGLADMGTVLGIYNPAEMPIWNLANVPFGENDVWVGPRAWYELRQNSPVLQAEAAENGVVFLNNFASGPAHLLTKEPILSVADLKGKKIRTTGGYVKWLEALGGTPVPLSFAETYPALDRGTIDGATNFIPSVKSFKTYEVAGHLTLIGGGQALGFGMAINKDLFEAMPEDLQKILSEAAFEMMDDFAERYIAGEEADKQQLIDGIDGHKVVFHELSEEERAKWAAAASGQVDEWVEAMKARGVDGAALVAELNEILAKYHAELETKGYPWTR